MATLASYLADGKGRRLAVVPALVEHNEHLFVRMLHSGGLALVLTDVGMASELVHPDNVAHALVRPTVHRMASKFKQVCICSVLIRSCAHHSNLVRAPRVLHPIGCLFCPMWGPHAVMDMFGT